MLQPPVLGELGALDSWSMELVISVSHRYCRRETSASSTGMRTKALRQGRPVEPPLLALGTFPTAQRKAFAPAVTPRV